MASRRRGRGGTGRNPPRAPRGPNDIVLPKNLPRMTGADQAVLDSVTGVEDYLKGELNARALTCTADEETWCTLAAEPDNKVLGKRLGRAFKDVKKAIAGLGHDDITKLQADGFLEVAGQRIEASEIDEGAARHVTTVRRLLRT